jgi:kynureninase
MDALTTKSNLLTGYLEFIIDTISEKHKEKCTFEIITPRNPKQRGAQISMFVHGKARELFDKLTDAGVIADWREPNVIRLAPVPMYNSFEDVYYFGQQLEAAIV